jgi:DNA-directed RNA polymerase subunit RPC12/RpoP
MADNVEDDGAHRYRRQWQAFRSRRNLIAVLLVAEFLSFLPFMALVGSVERRFFSTGKMFFPAALLFGALYIFTGSRLRSYPCPRCGKNFFGGFFATSKTMLGRNCAHCELPKYGEE